MISEKTKKVLIGLSTFAFALSLVALPNVVPEAHGLSAAAVTQLFASSSDEIDAQTTAQLPRLFVWLIGIIFAFGTLGIVLYQVRRRLRTLSGMGHS